MRQRAGNLVARCTANPYGPVLKDGKRCRTPAVGRRTSGQFFGIPTGSIPTGSIPTAHMGAIAVGLTRRFFAASQPQKNAQRLAQRRPSKHSPLVGLRPNRWHPRLDIGLSEALVEPSATAYNGHPLPILPEPPSWAGDPGEPHPYGVCRLVPEGAPMVPEGLSLPAGRGPRRGIRAVGTPP